MASRSGGGAEVQGIAFACVLKREYLREWQYTILAPLITLVLYMLVFGPAIGDRVGEMGNVAYIDYIFPGLVVLAIVLNAYNSSALSLYIDKFERAHQQWLTASVHSWVVMLGIAIGCAVRSMILVLLLGVIAFFTGAVPDAQSPLLACVTIVLTALLFSFAGIINAVFAESFDNISIVPNMVLMPLTFTGGVFYDPGLLPASMQWLTMLNPVFYMVDALRAAVAGNNHLPYLIDVLVILCLLLVSAGLCLRIFMRGTRLRS